MNYAILHILQINEVEGREVRECGRNRGRGRKVSETLLSKVLIGKYYNI